MRHMQCMHHSAVAVAVVVVVAVALQKDIQLAFKRKVDQCVLTGHYTANFVDAIIAISY